MAVTDRLRRSLTWQTVGVALLLGLVAGVATAWLVYGPAGIGVGVVVAVIVWLGAVAEPPD